MLVRERLVLGLFESGTLLSKIYLKMLALKVFL